MQRVIPAFILLFTLTCASTYAQKDLQYYIEQAKNNSPLIHQYRNEQEGSRFEIERLRGAYTKAQISLQGNFLVSPIISRDKGSSKLDWNPFIANKYSGYDLAASNGGAYVGLINLSQPLFNGKRFETFANQVNVDIEKNEINAQLTFHELEKTVTDQYIQCVMEYRQLEYTNNLLSIITRQQTIISRLVTKGTARRSDLSLLIIEQKAQEIAQNVARATYRSALMDLRVLCGISDTSYQVIEPPNLTLSSDVDTYKFVEQFRLDSLSLIADQQIFNLRYKPWTTLFANTGLNAVYVPTISDRFGLSAGINFGLTLSDGKQRSTMEQRTKTLLRTTQVSKSYFSRQNIVRKNKIKDELQSLSLRLEIMEEQLVEYQTLLTLYQEELDRGEVAVVNYLAALKEMTAANRDYTLMLAKRELLINEFNYWNW